MKPWYQDAYRRNVVDMHITDHDERFMSAFDARKYVDMLCLAQVQSTVLYAHSHVGLCYFPTRLGRMHPGLKGRNILGEVIDLCHQNGIGVVVYLSAIFDAWAYQQNPDWRIYNAEGQEAAAHSRYGICCPNSPYRDYIAGLAREVCEGFDFEGLRFDMTFWPRVCYCRHCARRFEAEVGGELPRVIHWADPRWVGFQRKREEWLADFAGRLTSTVKNLKPEASVEHQASTYPLDWRLGVTHRLAAHNDFLQGDFYGDALQGSFVRKLFYNLTPHRPGGFETCLSVDLGNYTALKSKDLLQAQASAALADGAALIFIDSLDPVGTLNPAAYERMGQVFETVKAYEPSLGGDLCQDVAVYLSTESKCDFADNGKGVDDPHLSGKMPHVDAAVSVCQSLIDHHLPFGVITEKNLGDLARHQVVVLPNVLMMDEEEAEAFREYVRAGGRLYASKYTSLVTQDGIRQPDFLLADVFGVSYRGETKESFTYIAPVEGAEHLLPEYTPEHPAGLYGSQFLVEAKPGAQVLGRLVLPYTDPADPTRFASIHNNPPGRPTDDPAIVLNRFGDGRAIYVAGDLENADPHREVFLNLLRLLGGNWSFAADAPKSVEMTLFHQEDGQRDLISLVNFQKELPNIPVDGIRVRVRLDGRTPKRLVVLPKEKEWTYALEDGYLTFTAPRLETLLMFAVEYEPAA